MENQLSTLAKLQNFRGIFAGFETILANALNNRGEARRAMQTKTLADVSFYHGKAVVGLASVTFFNGSTSGEYTNLPQFIRPQDEHTWITHVKLFEGAAAAVNATDWADGVSGTADVENGYFTIEVNGVVRLKQIPNFDSVVAADETDSGLIELLKPIFWGAQEDIKITETFAVAPATANQNMMFELKGLGLI